MGKKKEYAANEEAKRQAKEQRTAELTEDYHAGDALEDEFQKLYEEAQKAGATEALNVQIHQFEKPGEFLIGEFKEATILPETKFGGQVYRYLIQTATGLKSTILGSHADKEVLPTLKAGDLLRIEFQGQKALGDGKTVNLWDIQRFGKGK